MENNITDNRRIAKNTVALYFRMLFGMAVGAYTSRVILNTLGISDFGIYNVVGSIVGMFSFITGSMSLSTSRNLTYILGTDNRLRFEQLFKSSLAIHLIIAVIILILTEMVGLWFIQSKMSIPIGRFYAVQWVFHLSIISSVINIIFIPYTSAIIAFEKMSVYAWISIFDVTAKLAIVFLIQIIPYDKLIIYAILLLVVSVLNQMITFFYCRKQFQGTEYGCRWLKDDFIQLFSFAGWTMIGQIAFVAFTQGINMLLNIFFGPAVNAARGIAVQVQVILYNFVKNIQTAFNPQITKCYASNQRSDMFRLVYSCSKYSFYLLLVISVPVMLETPYLLQLWVKIVPEHTVTFFRIIILISFIDALANPLVISNMATGNVKYWNIICGSVLLLILPISYICLKMGCKPEVVFLVHLISAMVTQIIRLIILKHTLNFQIGEYVRNVFLPVSAVLVMTYFSGYYIMKLFPDGGIRDFSFVAISSVIIGVLSIITIGMTRKERGIAIKVAYKFVNKFRQI